VVYVSTGGLLDCGGGPDDHTDTAILKEFLSLPERGNSMNFAANSGSCQRVLYEDFVRDESNKPLDFDADPDPDPDPGIS